MYKRFIFDKLSEIQESYDLEYLNKYIDFCISNHDPALDKGANHHILSRTIFPEYENFNDNIWNLSRLSHYNHYIAHALLFKAINHITIGYAWYGMNNKNFLLEKDKPIELIGPELYEELILKRNKLCSENTSGKVMAKDLRTGKTIKVSKEEFDSNDSLVGHTAGFGGDHLKGTISVIDQNGVVTRIKKCDFNETHVVFNKGKFIAKDKDGNTFLIAKTDERYLSGELTAINKGRKFGEEFGKKISELRNSRGDTLGYRNPSANIIVIFNNKDEPIYISHGNFAQVCSDNNLSEQLLARTYKNNTKLYDYVDEEYIKSSRKWVLTKLFNSELYNNYKGWYARKMERIKI